MSVRQVIAEFLMGFRIVDVEMSVVACGYHLVGSVEGCGAAFAHEVDAEVVLHIGYAEQTEHGGRHVHLTGKVGTDFRTDARAADDERDMVETLRQFAVGRTPLLAVVAEEDEDGVGCPRFLTYGFHELADAVVRVAHNLLVLREFRVAETFGHDVGRMVADGQQRGEERTAGGRMATQHGERISE